MDIQAQIHEHSLVLIVKGTLNVIYTPLFQEKTQEYVNASFQHVVLDCTQIDYISSTGLRAILHLGKTLQAQGAKLALVAQEGFITQLFDNAGFTLLFPLKNSIEQAQAALIT